MAWTDSQRSPLTLGRIAQVWWPLAASWVLLGAELPMFLAVVARLPEPELNLAAWGAITSPLAMVSMSPFIMLLASSTALSRDRASCRRMHRYMMLGGLAVSALNLLVVLTPLYELIARRVIGAPEEILRPGRLGLAAVVPMAWAVGYRRFHQGVLIRYGYSRSVGTGTLLRLLAGGAFLAAGALLEVRPGVVVAAVAWAGSSVVEALYAGWRARPVLRTQMEAALPGEPPLTLWRFAAFYVPLALTTMLMVAAQPMGGAALSRMPLALPSLAVYPVVTGLVAIVRNLGLGYNEVVVALFGRPGSARELGRFALLLSGLATALLLAVAATPLAGLWFSRVSSLDPELSRLAGRGLWIALPGPGLAAIVSWRQGILVHTRQTRSVTESVVLSLASAVAILVAGMAWGRVTGLYVGLAAFATATAAQAAWLWHRSAPALLKQSQTLPKAPQPAA